jgi:cysteine desulfurase
MKQVYLDNASSTPIDPGVLEKMYEYDKEFFANPSALHISGAQAKKRLDSERSRLAQALQAKPGEICFTSGGTESDVLALRGTVECYRKNNSGKTPHIIVSNIEHSAVLDTAKMLESEGVRVTYISPKKNGIVRALDIMEFITPETILVSLMYINNEIGTVQPVGAVAKLMREYRNKHSTMYPIFHTDACQAANHELITAPRLGADLITINASKIYGPKGVGVLYVAKGTPIYPILTGGGQEGGLRSGTESVSLVIGLAESFISAQSKREEESNRLKEIQKFFFKEIEKRFTDVVVQGDLIQRVPNNISITVPGIQAEELVIRLAAKGIEVSSKSACSSIQTDGSYVILAIGGTEEDARQTLRITTGRQTTREDIEYFLQTLEQLLKDYRI